MRRTFRHDAERRTWWIERDGRTLRIGASSDDAPDDAFERTRKATSEATAQSEVDALIADQIAEGFAEIGAPPAPSPSDAATFFETLLATWRTCAPDVDASRWHENVVALPAAWRERLHRELEALAVHVGPWPERREKETWLRMQAEMAPDALLLALRHPRLWAFALGALEGTMSASGYAPHARAHDLERALVSLVETPPPPAYDGNVPAPAPTTTIFRHPFGEASITRFVSIAQGADLGRATNAALLLARYPALARADARAALGAWLARADHGRSPLGAMVIERAVAELGVTLLRDAKRPATAPELASLLARAERRDG